MINVFTAPTTFFFAFLLLTNPAAAQRNILGKQFWLISETNAYNQGVSSEYFSRRRELGSGAKWIRVTGDSLVVHYDVELSTGESDKIRKDWLDAAIEKKILVDYDPAAAAEAARLKQTRKD